MQNSNLSFIISHFTKGKAYQATFPILNIQLGKALDITVISGDRVRAYFQINSIPLDTTNKDLAKELMTKYPVLPLATTPKWLIKDKNKCHTIKDKGAKLEAFIII